MFKFNGTPKKELRSGTGKLDALNTRISKLDEEIRELENQLGDSQYRLDGAAEAARTRRGESPRGGARRMKTVTTDLLKENNSIKNKLASLKAKRKRLLEKKRVEEIKHQYAGESVMNGGINMGNFYTDEDVRDAKLKIYESCRVGDITKDEAQELLEALQESVEDYNDRLDAYLAEQEMYNESVDDGLDFNAMKVFVYESAEQGLLTEDEKDYMLQYL